MGRIIRSPRPVANADSLITAAAYLEVAIDPVTRQLVRKIPSIYIDGTGSWPDAAPVMDCVGFALSRCSQIPRHRPSYNRDLLTKLLAQGMDPTQAGAYAFVLDVEDDVNTNSMIGDALTDQDLVQFVGTPQEGDLLVYPTVKLVNASGKRWEGHAAKVTGVSRLGSLWNPARPDYALIDTAQCVGPNDHEPGVIATDGRYFAEWRATWPRPEHTVRILRLIA